MQHYAQRELDEADYHAQLERASIWYEQRGLLADAVDAALDAQAFSRAARLIENLLSDDFPSELVTLQGWIERLPAEILPDYPEIAFAYAAAILFTPERHLRPTLAAVDRPLRMAEQRWEAEEKHEQLGRVTALRALTAMWQGNMPEAYALAHEALRLIPESSPDLWRSSALILASREALDAGQLNAAQRFALEARALNEAARNPDGTRAATIVHGYICYEQGQLHQAFHLLQQVLIQVPGGNQYEAISDRGYIFWGLGLVEFEWNDLEAAHQHTAGAARIGRQIADIHLEVLATILLARVEHAQGQSKQAQHRLEALVTTAPPGDLLWSIQTWQAQLSLAGNNLPLVELWRARRAWRQETPLSPALIVQETLLMARLHVLEGHPELALDDLERCRANAHATGWTRAELEASLLIAQAHHLQGDAESARSLLTRALALAQPENIRRLCLDEGEPLAAAIHAALPDIADKRLLSFARALLVDLAQTGHHPGSADALPDPLSAQEQRVLRLLAAGLSNGEIAQELVVSTNTIKSQLKSIYRKLNVSSREEAREAAHDFHLLS
jgi:LuxR family maltose regulon positive regulatory protein